MGMHKSGGTKTRGRSKGTTHLIEPNPTHPNVPQTMRSDATRPIGRGGTKQRGDRRDTNQEYSGNFKNHQNHTNPMGKGRAQTQGGGKGLKGGGKRQKGTYDH